MGLLLYPLLRLDSNPVTSSSSMLPSLTMSSVLVHSKLQPHIKYSKGPAWSMPPQTSALVSSNADGYGCAISLALSSYVLEQRGLPDGNTKKTHSWKWSVKHCVNMSSLHTTKKEGRKGRSTELRLQSGCAIFVSLWKGVLK